MPMLAKLVHDYSGDPVLPERQLPEGDDPWGVIAQKGQFQGTPAEKLSEICGRICYDSFGKGRDSKAYHDHILEVNHGSVYEHFNYTVLIVLDGDRFTAELLTILANRPGVWLEFEHNTVRITLNLRSTVEWHRWSRHAGFTADSTLGDLARNVGARIRTVANKLAPQVVRLGTDDEYQCALVVELVQALHQEEQGVSMVMGGSRGFSHELVRHGDRTAISQRSTRYVDEDGSEYVTHPLLTAYCEDPEATINYMMEQCEYDEAAVAEVRASIEKALVVMHKSTEADREAYRAIVEGMQPWLVSQGADKFTARKQARGAARGFLGNALYTEMVFSASVAQWHRIFRQRCGLAADAEIREIGCQALRAIKESQYGYRFENWDLQEDHLGWFGVEREEVTA